MTAYHTTESDTPAPTSPVGAIVVAAGASTRMQGQDKIFAPLSGKPLLSYSIQALQDAPEIDAIVLVLSAHNIQRGQELVRTHGWSKVRDVCPGGARRQDSVRCGLDALADCQWVVVQDGARPFIDPDMVSRGLAEARRCGAATAAVPVKDTIKVAGSDMVVLDTPPRERLWAVQTPQVFRRVLLEEAHRKVPADSTDDASMVERIGGAVRIFMGSYQNIKVTTPEDLAMAESILREHKG